MTFEKVAEILADYKDCDKSAITLDTTFEELQFDSLDIVDLVMNLEESFGINIEMDENLKTVGQVVELIDNAKA